MKDFWTEKGLGNFFLTDVFCRHAPAREKCFEDLEQYCRDGEVSRIVTKSFDHSFDQILRFPILFKVWCKEYYDC